MPIAPEIHERHRPLDVRWSDRNILTVQSADMRASYPSAATLGAELSNEHLTTCFHAFLDDAGCAVAVCDADGRIHFVNRTAMDLVGLKGEDPPLGKSLHDIIPAHIADMRIALIRRALVAESSQPFIGLCATDGAWRRLVVRALDRAPGAERALLVCSPLAETVTLADLVGPHQAFCETSVDLGPLARLTEREMQVLRLIGLGLSTQEIAERLHRSKKTIEWHRVSLGAKLDVSNRVELARLALRAGLTWFDEDAITHIWRRADRTDAPAAEPE